MSAAVKPALPSTQCYQRRRPEHTLWYRTVQAHFETWLALAAGPDDAAPPAYVEQAFRRYLEATALNRNPLHKNPPPNVILMFRIMPP